MTNFTIDLFICLLFFSKTGPSGVSPLPHAAEDSGRPVPGHDGLPREVRVPAGQAAGRRHAAGRPAQEDDRDLLARGTRLIRF